MLADLIVDLERDVRSDRLMHRGADTHWSRILSYDLDGSGDASSSTTASLLDEARPDSNGGERTRHRFVNGAAIVFAVCAVAYLAVTGSLHALQSPDGIGVPPPDGIGVFVPKGIRIPARNHIDAPAEDRPRVPVHERGVSLRFA